MVKIDGSTIFAAGMGLLLTCALAACFSVGTRSTYHLNEYASKGGYLAVFSIRTNLERAEKPGWEANFVGPGREITMSGLRAHGHQVQACELLGQPSMNQGGMLMMVFVAGDESFVERASGRGAAFYGELIRGAPIIATENGLFPEL